MEETRAYRRCYTGDLQRHSLVLGETDLAICLPPGVWQAPVEQGLRDHLIRLRGQLQAYLAEDPAFAATHSPYTPSLHAPAVAKALAKAGNLAKTGPMAAVAGYFAAAAGTWLAAYSGDVIVENGGDIYLHSCQPRTVAIYAGPDNPFSGKLALRLPPEKMPCGVCTSSGTIGPSFSYGVADAAVVVAADAALADAVATAAGNLVKDGDSVAAAVEYALQVSGVWGGVMICGDKMAAAGDIELVRL
ncbi:MAG: UPF0280 family protein [Firmicutes bacterium]|nr:UPF0280 family protein [Bacillota bacterium]